MESVYEILLKRIKTVYPDAEILVHDHSAQHHGHYENSKGSDTHFDVKVKSALAVSLSRVERERRVHSAIGDLYTERGLHALSLTFEAP